MPTSYQAPMAGDKAKQSSSSQTVAAATQMQASRVEHLLKEKSGAVITVAQSDTIAAAVTILKENRIGALIVTDASGTLTGILSERDIVRKLAQTPGQTLPQTVGENMTRSVVTCAPEDTLIHILRRMSEGRFRHMPVMQAGKPIGMITIGDVVAQRLKEVEQEALQLKQLIVG
jgi:CBS domain-containing protein